MPQVPAPPSEVSTAGLSKQPGRLYVVGPDVRTGPRVDGSDLIAAVSAVMKGLVADSDPVTVFAHLAQLLVPDVSDSATISFQPDPLESGEQSAPSADSVVPLAPVGATAVEPAQCALTMSFGTTPAVPDSRRPAPQPDHYRVALTCTWSGIEPTASEIAVMDLLGSYAEGVVHEAWLGVSMRAAEERIRNLEIALVSNRLIGAAVGVLMTQHRLTYERAFDLLAATSQHANAKIGVLADHVMRTGELPR